MHNKSPFLLIVPYSIFFAVFALVGNKPFRLDGEDVAHICDDDAVVVGGYEDV